MKLQGKVQHLSYETYPQKAANEPLTLPEQSIYMLTTYINMVGGYFTAAHDMDLLNNHYMVKKERVVSVMGVTGVFTLHYVFFCAL